MQLSEHDTYLLAAFQREYEYFDRYRRSIETATTDIAEAKKKTGASGLWAKAVTIPRLTKKRESDRQELATRREKLKFATEGALYSVGSKAMNANGVSIPSKSERKAYALTRYFYVLAELAQAADAKISYAVGKRGENSPMDYYSGYQGRSGMNYKSMSQDYKALMDAGDYARMFQQHIRDAGEAVHNVFAQVGVAKSVHNALGRIYSYPGSVDAMLLSRRPEKARQDLMELRDSIRRIHDSFIREVANAQALYPGQSGKMNAAMLNAISAHTADIKGGDTLLDKMRDAMGETGMKIKPPKAVTPKTVRAALG